MTNKPQPNFLMRPPVYMDGGVYNSRNEYDAMLYDWQLMTAVLEACGANLQILSAQSAQSKEDTSRQEFVRDPVFVIPELKKVFVPNTQKCRVELSSEQQPILSHIPKDFEVVSVDASFEGGNLIYDPTRNVIFQGAGHGTMSRLERVDGKLKVTPIRLGSEENCKALEKAS